MKNRQRSSSVSSAFAANLKKVLKERGLSQRAAAEICGVNATSITDWLAGMAPRDLSAVLRLCQAIKVDFQWLLTGQHSEVRLEDLSLNEIFEIEHDPAFSGMFVIEAKRLKRRSKKTSDDKGGK